MSAAHEHVWEGRLISLDGRTVMANVCVLCGAVRLPHQWPDRS